MARVRYVLMHWYFNPNCFLERIFPTHGELRASPWTHPLFLSTHLYLSSLASYRKSIVKAGYRYRTPHVDVDIEQRALRRRSTEPRRGLVSC